MKFSAKNCCRLNTCLLERPIARKRAEYATAGIEVFSSKMETLTKSLDPEVPVTVLDLPIGQLVLQVINGKQELTSVQAGSDGALGEGRRAHCLQRPPRGDRWGGRGRCYVPESLLAKWRSIGRQYAEYNR